MHTKQRKHNQLTKATRPKTKQKNQNHKQRQLCYHGAYRLRESQQFTIAFHLNRMRRHKDVKKTHFIGKLTGSQTMFLNKG